MKKGDKHSSSLPTIYTPPSVVPELRPAIKTPRSWIDFVLATKRTLGEQLRLRGLSIDPESPMDLRSAVKRLDFEMRQLSLGELDVLFAFMKMLTQTGYKYNGKGRPFIILDGNMDMLFKAMGLDSVGGSKPFRYAERDLFNLGHVQRLLYIKEPLKKDPESGIKRWRVCAIYDTIIKMWFVNDEIDEEVLERLKSNFLDTIKKMEKEERPVVYAIALHEIFGFAQLDRGFSMLPDIMDELKEYHRQKGGKRIVEEVYFLFFLSRQMAKEVVIDPKKLADQLHMQSELRAGRTQATRQKLNRIYKVAKELGYLNDYTPAETIVGNVTDRFLINRDRFKYRKPGGNDLNSGLGIPRIPQTYRF